MALIKVKILDNSDIPASSAASSGVSKPTLLRSNSSSERACQSSVNLNKLKLFTCLISIPLGSKDEG